MPIRKAIKARNFEAFDTAFKKGIKGCNGCHEDAGYDFIVYELPEAPTAPLSMKPPPKTPKAPLTLKP